MGRPRAARRVAHSRLRHRARHGARGRGGPDLVGPPAARLPRDRDPDRDGPRTPGRDGTQPLGTAAHGPRGDGRRQAGGHALAARARRPRARRPLAADAQAALPHAPRRRPRAAAQRPARALLGARRTARPARPTRPRASTARCCSGAWRPRRPRPGSSRPCSANRHASAADPLSGDGRAAAARDDDRARPEAEQRQHPGGAEAGVGPVESAGAHLDDPRRDLRRVARASPRAAACSRLRARPRSGGAAMAAPAAMASVSAARLLPFSNIVSPSGSASVGWSSTVRARPARPHRTSSLDCRRAATDLATRSRAAEPRRSPLRACARRACAGWPRRGGRRSSPTGTAAPRCRRCAAPAPTSPSTSTSRAVSPAGFVPRRGARAARQPAHAALAQAARRRSPPRAARRGAGAPRRRAHGAVVVGGGERQRRLVRTAQLGPQLGRAPAVSPASCGRIGRGDAVLRSARRPRRRRRQAARSPIDPRRMAAHARARGRPRSPPPRRSSRPSSHAASARAAATGPRRCSSPVGSASASASSSAGQTSGSPRLARTRPSTVEREDPRHRPRATVAQRRGGGVGRLRPQPPVELQAGAAGDEEQPPQVQAALGAVLEACVEVAIDDVIAAHAQRPPHEVEVGAPGVLLQPGAQRELQAALELRRRLRGVGEDLDTADVGERIARAPGRRRAARPARAPPRSTRWPARRPPRSCGGGRGWRRRAPARARGAAPRGGSPPRGRPRRPARCARRSGTGARESAGSRLR